MQSSEGSPLLAIIRNNLRVIYSDLSILCARLQYTRNTRTVLEPLHPAFPRRLALRDPFLNAEPYSFASAIVAISRFIFMP
jgi:hypothetical protein